MAQFAWLLKSRHFQDGRALISFHLAVVNTPPRRLVVILRDRIEKKDAFFSLESIHLNLFLPSRLICSHLYCFCFRNTLSYDSLGIHFSPNVQFFL